MSNANWTTLDPPSLTALNGTMKAKTVIINSGYINGNSNQNSNSSIAVAVDANISKGQKFQVVIVVVIVVVVKLAVVVTAVKLAARVYPNKYI